MSSIQHPAKGRRSSLRTSLLAAVAVCGLSVGIWQAPAFSATPAPANANLSQAVVDTGYADLVEAVKPAVVNVRIERTGGDDDEDQQQSPMQDPEMRRFFERFFGEGNVPQQAPPQQHRVVGEGSGFVINADGFVVTNAHVAGKASKIEVALQDGTRLDAKLIGVDEKTDLAVIKVNAGKPLPYVTFADSGKVRVGDKVIAVGNPFGLGGTVTAGIVSATGREIGSGPYDDFLQVDAPINRGNSGGPTFNLRGEVVGVNTAIFSPSGGSVGIGFAIASNLAKEIVNDLMDDGKVQRGWLGVSIQPLDQDLAQSLALQTPSGALVNEVQDSSPAEKAGFRRGDVILTFDGKPIDRLSQLTRAVAEVPPGTPADVVVWRDGKQETLHPSIAALPAKQEVASTSGDEQASPQPRLGLGLAALTAETRSHLNLDGDVQGVVVTQVVPDSPADDKGIEQGDIIVSVNKQAVREPRQVMEAVRKAQADGGKSVLLLVQRDGRQRYEAVPLATS